MANIQDYLAWRGDLSFVCSPFNEVDALIFSEFAYLHFDKCGCDKGITLKDAAVILEKDLEFENQRLGLLVPHEILSLLIDAAKTVRFSDVLLTNYESVIDEGREMQFSAICFETEDFSVMAFRGTDDTLIGWKEDCNMCFLFPIPSQKMAEKYLSTYIKNHQNKPMYICGHSKGGNLAVYAAANGNSDVFERIRFIYNFDGPGFRDETIATNIYDFLGEKLISFTPEDSLVGTIMEYNNTFHFVKSTATGTLQNHNAFTWEVLGPHFNVLNSEPNNVGLKTYTLKSWLAELSPEERKDFVEGLFAVREKTNAKSLLELFNNPLQTLPALIRAYDSDTRELLKGPLSLLLKIGKDVWYSSKKEEHLLFKQKLAKELQIYLTEAEASLEDIGTFVQEQIAQHVDIKQLNEENKPEEPLMLGTIKEKIQKVINPEENKKN